jgi:hypothetical protein
MQYNIYYTFSTNKHFIDIDTETGLHLCAIFYSYEWKKVSPQNFLVGLKTNFIETRHVLPEYATHRYINLIQYITFLLLPVLQRVITVNRTFYNK